MDLFILFEYARPLVVVLAVLFLFIIFLFITARVHWMIRFIGVPLIMAVSIYSYAYLDKVLGYPYPGEIPKGSVYLGRHLQSTDKNLYFVVWAYPQGETRSRLYLIPFKQSQQKKFREGVKKAGRGDRLGIRRAKPREDEDGNLISKDYELYKIKEINYPPKTAE